MKYTLTIILLALISSSCSTINYVEHLSGQSIRGIVVDKVSGEALIGQQLVEFGNYSNTVSTNIDGEFEIVFQGQIPVIELHGFYEPIIVQIESGRFNKIEFDKRLVKNSSNIYRKANRLYKSTN